MFAILLLSASLLIHPSQAEWCFGWDGSAYPNNKICPGSSACCGEQAECLPNRLCHNPGDNNSTFVRGPCAVDPYDASVCATICLRNETLTDGLLPRVTMCADGSFCCDRDPTCCSDGRGVWLADGGKILTSSPSATSTSTPTSTTTTVTATTASSSENSPPTPALTSSDASSTPLIVPYTSTLSPAAPQTSSASVTAAPAGLTTAAKIGLGIGVPLAVAAIGAICFAVYILHRRRASPPQTAPQEMHQQWFDQGKPYINANYRNGLEQTPPNFTEPQAGPLIFYEMPAYPMNPRELDAKAPNTTGGGEGQT